MGPRLRTTVTPSSSRTCIETTDNTILKSTTTLPSYWVPSSWVNSYISTVPGYSKSIADYVTPNFKKLRAEGKIINNPLEIAESLENIPAPFVSYERKTYRHMTLSGARVEGLQAVNKLYGDVDFKRLIGTANAQYLEVTPATVDIERLIALTVNSCHSKIASSDLLIGASIAESGKTVSDLLKLSRKILKVARFLKHPRLPKRINKKSIRAAHNEAEELYMQVRYMLRPLYYDILGVMKVSSKQFYTDRFTYRASADDSVSLSSTDIVCPWWYQTAVKLRLQKTSSYSVVARAGVLCAVHDQALWARAGLSLIPELAWELVPFSFIADWFANFGDIVSAWAPTPGISKLASWVTITERWLQDITVSVDSITEVDNPTFVLGTISRTETSVDGLEGVMSKATTVITRRPNPRRSYVPRLSVNLSIPKLIDLAIIGKNLSRAFRS